VVNKTNQQSQRRLQWHNTLQYYITQQDAKNKNKVEREALKEALKAGDVKKIINLRVSNIALSWIRDGL
jgi:hypothetical protein